jgi:hypothetical protein
MLERMGDIFESRYFVPSGFVIMMLLAAARAHVQPDITLHHAVLDAYSTVVIVAVSGFLGFVLCACARREARPTLQRLVGALDDGLIWLLVRWPSVKDGFLAASGCAREAARGAMRRAGKLAWAVDKGGLLPA